jgi:spermidine synthase
MTLILCFIFFISGAAALIFETLWFRVAGLQLGNSVWTSSIVLAAFMCGLAVGNALAVRYGDRIARLLLAYAAIEAIVALSSFGVIVSMPHITPVIVPLVRFFSSIYGGVNLLRWSVAFGAMLVPATAMGMTLPLLTKALARIDSRFGSILGKLYGWNTLGGVIGIMGAELLLIGSLGIRATGLVAASGNVFACLVALIMMRHHTMKVAPRLDSKARVGLRSLPGYARRLLAATVLLGAAILALEVVWFRFIQLFIYGTALAFSAMLAVILAGIGSGGLVASFWLKRREPKVVSLPMIALAAGIATEMSYFFFSPTLGAVTSSTNNLPHSVVLSLRLMFPTTFLSGVLFTLYGHILRRHCGEETETAGLLTFFNTVGATMGALCGGLILLPSLGMESSIFILTLVYGVAAALTLPKIAVRDEKRLLVGVVALSVVCFALFPFGAMKGRYLRLAWRQFVADGSEIVDFREGLTESIGLIRSQWGNEPVSYRLVTNAHSMSATTFLSTRYMTLFAYWPMALRPGARNALLISYGLGMTASALHLSPSLESVDVVDISRDVIEVSKSVHPPDAHPLRDARFHVHIEDGRFFLHTANKRYDLITAEPPPPKGAGIINLYTREFFRLVKDRLSPSGVATYWLPVHSLTPSDVRSIVKAFCVTFEDCSLWRGAGADWMLAGSRGNMDAVSAEALRSFWDDPKIGPSLIDIGIEIPEQLCALFIADQDALFAYSKGALPLEDNYPGRLTCPMPTNRERDSVLAWADTTRVVERFSESVYIEKIFPKSLRRATIPYLAYAGQFDDVFLGRHLDRRYAVLDDVLRSTRLRTFPLLLMASEPKLQKIAHRAMARGIEVPAVLMELGIGCLARRDYAAAESLFRRVMQDDPTISAAGFGLALALHYQERDAESSKVFESIDLRRPGIPESGYRWLKDQLTNAS